MIIAICSSAKPPESDGGPDIIYRVKKIHQYIKVRSTDVDYVILEIEECDLNPDDDPLVIKLGSSDAVLILWRQKLWKLVDSSAITVISILAGIGTITEGIGVLEDEIEDSIAQLRTRLTDKDDGQAIISTSDPTN